MSGSKVSTSCSNKRPVMNQVLVTCDVVCEQFLFRSLVFDQARQKSSWRRATASRSSPQTGWSTPLSRARSSRSPTTPSATMIVSWLCAEEYCFGISLYTPSRFFHGVSYTDPESKSGTHRRVTWQNHVAHTKITGNYAECVWLFHINKASDWKHSYTTFFVWTNHASLYKRNAVQFICTCCKLD